MINRKFRTLGEVSHGSDNNLDFIRFIAATMVIYSYSFPLSGGVDGKDILSFLTDGWFSFGSLAVSIFFFYGGFLICKSMCRQRSFKKYFKSRILRIFPPLIVVCAGVAFIVGPFLTEFTAEEYFKNSEVYKYMLNGILVLRHNLPGVFLHNVYGQTVNGSLWTLPVEFLCYIMCFLMYKVRFLEEKTMKWTVPFFLLDALP